MKPLPSAAGNTSTAGNATPWANSAYVQLSAGLGAAAILASIVPSFSAITAITEVEFDIATGGAGSEVVRSTYRGLFISQGLITPWTVFPLLDNLPNARIAYRYRKGDTTTLNNSAAINYFLQSGFGAEVSAQAQKVLPAAADGFLLTPNYSTTLYGTCPWVEATSGLGADIVITGFVLFPTSNHSSGRPVFQIAKGASGSEVVVASFSSNNRFDSASAGTYGPVWLPIPLDVFPAGTRIAVRVLPPPSSLAPTFRAALQYVEKPL